MKLNKTGKFIISIIICQLAGIVGSIFTSPASLSWYAELQKPDFTPPSSLFAPVWIFLFFLMGISLFIIWNQDTNRKEVRVSLFLFYVQLILNIVWSLLFFGLRDPLLGLNEIVVLWFVIAATIFEFQKVSKKAALLLIPYILWVSFAVFLNFSIWRLNL